MRRFRWMIANRAVDIVQPDLHYFGGFIRSTKVAKMAEAAGMPCTVHMSGAGLGYMYVLHFASYVRDAGAHQEFKGTSRIPIECKTSDLKCRNGIMRVPSGPGFGVTIDPEQFKRNFYSTSSCGVCGKASIDAIRVAKSFPPPGPMVDRETLLALPPMLLERQSAFHATGGLHAAAVFEPSGDILAVREDIGRHNAVDKLVGYLARQSWPLPSLGLLVSGRVSFEIVQKAAVAGISLVCGVSAASSLAVELADEFGMTVVGFLREGGFTVYAGEERIEGLST